MCTAGSSRCVGAPIPQAAARAMEVPLVRLRPQTLLDWLTERAESRNVELPAFPAMAMRLIHAVRDVAFLDGKVAEVAERIDAEAKHTIDATGKIVSPGLIDVHVHVFAGVSHYGIEPDPTCLARGATTVVDAGSAGADTFPGFRKYVIDVSETRILAQMNISSQGMLTEEFGE